MADQAVIQAIYRRASRVSDPATRRRYLKAALETGIVESGLTNPAGGDADSAGWRQERASLYKNPTNITASVNRFFNELAAVDRGQPSYELAAEVQRPAAQYRDRYRQVQGQANALMSGGGAAPLSETNRRLASTTSTTTTPGVDNRLARYQLVRSYLDSNTVPQAQFLQQFQQLHDVAPTTTTTTTPGAAGTTPNAGLVHASGIHGSLAFDGTQVAAWIQPILKYARAQGWQGSVSSGVRTYADQKRIYDSGVRPAAVPGTSNHEMTAFPGGAIDVTDAAQLSQILRGSKYRNLLVWAGAKDPVHFSHPHNGSY